MDRSSTMSLLELCARINKQSRKLSLNHLKVMDFLNLSICPPCQALVKMESQLQIIVEITIATPSIIKMETQFAKKLTSQNQVTSITEQPFIPATHQTTKDGLQIVIWMGAINKRQSNLVQLLLDLMMRRRSIKSIHHSNSTPRLSLGLILLQLLFLRVKLPSLWIWESHSVMLAMFKGCKQVLSKEWSWSLTTGVTCNHSQHQVKTVASSTVFLHSFSLDVHTNKCRTWPSKTLPTLLQAEHQKKLMNNF